MKTRNLILTVLFFPFMSYSQFKEKPKAEFSVVTDKTEIMEGECATIKVSFTVHVKNKVRIYFTDMGNQIINLRNKILENVTFNCDTEIQNIEPKMIQSGQNYFRQYNIIELAICPYDVDDIIIPSLSLTLINQDDGNKDITFKSDPISIRVNKIPKETSDKISKNNGYELVGDFKIFENIQQKESNVGDTINYKLRLSGSGNLFHLNTPKVNNDIVSIDATQVISEYTIQNNVLWFSKSFNLEIIAKKPGSFQLSQYLNWTFYSGENNEVYMLLPKSSFTILSSEKPFIYKEEKEGNVVLAIDVSASMSIIENNNVRIEKAIDIGNKLFKYDCHKILLFSGDVYQYSKCNLDKQILDYSIKPGTNIGNTIWESIEYLENKPGRKSLIIISDGDNNISNISVLKASEIAKEKGINIYTIGLGQESVLKYIDPSGQEQSVVNSYYEETLKAISENTNGKFFRIEKKSQIDDVVKNIRRFIKK